MSWRSYIFISLALIGSITFSPHKAAAACDPANGPCECKCSRTYNGFDQEIINRYKGTWGWEPHEPGDPFWTTKEFKKTAKNEAECVAGTTDPDGSPKVQQEKGTRSEGSFSWSYVKFTESCLYFPPDDLNYCCCRYLEESELTKKNECYFITGKIGQPRVCDPKLFTDKNGKETGLGPLWTANAKGTNGCETLKTIEKKKASTVATPQFGASVETIRNEARDLNKLGFREPAQLVGQAIRVLLLFIGSIALVLYIYAGFLWMTAAGNAERVRQAQQIIIWATLGLIIMLASFVLVRFLFQTVLRLPTV